MFMMASCEVIDDFQDIDGDMFGDCLKGSAADGLLEDSSGLQDCNICSYKLCNPRILSCLHVFCEACLDKLLIDEAGDTAKNERDITCPSCKQETKVNNKGASSLPPDYVSSNIIEPLTTEGAGSIHCTSCKSKEEAMAYCRDCSNFLCPNCNTAHQYMRCFDNHKVVKLAEMDGDSISIHKPIYCSNHSTECLKFFCFTCQIPICNECLENEHKTLNHLCEHAKDAEIRIRKELESLMKESQSKEKFCEQASASLENALGDLQQQRDTAKDLIMESFQSYKAVLEKCRDNALNELDSLHSDRELKIMELFHNVEKTVEKIEDACKFTSRLLQQGNCHEVITLKKIITAQFLKLINNTPKLDVNYLVEFETSFDKFESTIKEAFGEFRTESSVLSPKDITPPPTVSSLPPILNHTGSSGISLSNGGTNSLATSSPISLPTSMQSSFDSEISTLGTGFNLAGNVLVPDSPGPALPVGAGLQLSSIAEYNLQQLASLAEKTETVAVSNNSSPSPSFSLADLFTGDISSTNNALNNLQALAKLGLNGADLTNAILPVVTSSIDSVNNVSSLDLTSALISPISDDLTLSSTRAVTPSGNIFSASRGSTNVKLTPMQIRCKFGQLGATKGQFNSPHGFCLGLEEDIIVADTNNHRIEVFEKTGTFKFQFGIPGKEEGQLWYPRKVAVMRTSGKFVVCDRGNERSRMQIFTKNGHFIKKIGIRYIDIVAGLAVTTQGHIVAVDSVSPTVFVIAESGDLLHWFDCSDYMREPSDIAINGKEYFVCDFKGHCVVVFSEDGIFQRRIGGENITNFPNGIDISDAGDVLIGDSHGNRFHVAVFSRDGTLVSEFECPYVKVSRCCGLKITSEGYIVTLAKNNHHVLVLNTLYIL